MKKITELIIFFDFVKRNIESDKVKFDIIPKTNEEYISVTYGCINLLIVIDFYQVV